MSTFEADPNTPLIYGGGEWRKLTSRPTPKKMMASFPPFGASNPVIPRSQWRAVSRGRLEIPIMDQGQIGSCVGHGAATGLMLARDIGGQSFELLSPTFIYSLINGGQDNGAIPGDAARVLLEIGTCLMSEVPEGVYQKAKIPKSAYETAKRFRALEVYSCANFDEAVSAFLLGFSVFDTINVGPNFNTLNADGVPPLTKGPGNHCVAFGDGLKRDRSGNWVVHHRNSWSTAWGDDGCYCQTEAHCVSQGKYYEAWAVKSVTDDPLADNIPPGDSTGEMET